MTLRTLHLPHLGRTVKLGRRPPAARGPRLELRRYLKLDKMVGIPEAVDYRSAASAALRDVMGNDSLGDCVIAGGYHVVGLETGNAGALFHATPEQVLRDYSAVGGYVPGDPSTDNGCNLVDALNYWTEKGFANGTKLLAWLAIDEADPVEVRAALYLFENLYMGIGLPDPWIRPFPNGDGFTWDLAGSSDPRNGHSIMAPAYDKGGVIVDTWGLYGTITDAAMGRYCGAAEGGELYVMLTPDQLAKGQAKAPNGVAWDELLGDWNRMGGNVVVPAGPPVGPPVAPPVIPPSPQPPLPIAPPVTPVTPVAAPTATLPEAQAWACAGLAANWPKGRSWVDAKDGPGFVEIPPVVNESSCDCTAKGVRDPLQRVHAFACSSRRR